MTTWYISKQSGAADTNNGTSSSTPFLTLAHLLTVMRGGDTALFRSGDTWNEQLTITPSLSGTASQYTTFGAFSLNLGNAKALIIPPNPSTTPAINFTAGGIQYIEFDDLAFTENVNPSPTTYTQNLGIVSTPSGGISYVNVRRCYFYHIGNTIFVGNNGPVPRSSAQNGTGSGDDTGWLWENCEFWYNGNSQIIWYGSAATWRTCHFHRWAESNLNAPKPCILNASLNSVIDTCYFHNEEPAVGTYSGPSYSVPIDIRASGVTVRDCLFHDCPTPCHVSWRDNYDSFCLYLRNRGWNIYGSLFYFSAANDTVPNYTWGPNAVDRFIFANNTFHLFGSAATVFDLTHASAVSIGGLTISNNVFVGNYTTYAINAGINTFQPNPANNITGKLLEQNNLWFSTVLNATGNFNWANINRTLAQWKAAGVISGNNQGVNSFYNNNPNLGSAPAGSAERAPSPYQYFGVIQTPGDNSLISNTYGAPDYYPQTGSPVIDAGTTVVDSAVTYVQAQAPPPPSGLAQGIGLFQLGGSLSQTTQYTNPIVKLLVVSGNGGGTDANTAAGLNLVSFIYMDAMIIRTDGGSGVDYNTANSLGYVTSTPSASYPAYYADITNTNYHAWFAQQAVAYAQSYPGIKGIYLDDIGREANGAPFTAAQYTQYNPMLVQAMATALSNAGFVLMTNSIAYVPGDPNSDNGVNDTNWWQLLASKGDTYILSEDWQELRDGSNALRLAGSYWPNWQTALEQYVAAYPYSGGHQFVGLSYANAGEDAKLIYCRASQMLAAPNGLFIGVRWDNTDPWGDWATASGTPVVDDNAGTGSIGGVSS